MPTVGTKFQHGYWLDQQNNPIVYIVTAIRKGWIYYKFEDADKAKEKCSFDRWQKVCGKVLENT